MMYPCKSGKIPPIDSRAMVDTKLSRRRPGSALKLICPTLPLVGGHNDLLSLNYPHYHLLSGALIRGATESPQSLKMN